MRGRAFRRILQCMKRHTALLAAISIALPLAASAAGIAITVDGTVVVLRDVHEGSWYTGSVKAASDAGIVSGYRDSTGKPTGYFGPADPVTVAQALKMAVIAAGYDTSEYTSRCGGGRCLSEFSDHWAAPYIAVAQLEEFGITLTPATIDKRATRAQVAQITADAFISNWAGDVSGLRDYTDVSTEHRHAQAIVEVTISDIMVGDGRTQHCLVSFTCKKTTFRPDDPINRAEAVKVTMTARAVHGTPHASEGGGASSSGDASDKETIVTYTDAGFAPEQLSITRGMTVVFRNKSSSQLWVASDPHPVHTALPALDAGHGIATNAEFRFRFMDTGAWGFHNHLQSSHQGSVTVLP